MDDKDKLRFIHNLYEFNDRDAVVNSSYFFDKSIDFASRYEKLKPRKLLVDVLAFCLMPNHYHLMLRKRGENGIVDFMRKINIGYAKYFNIKYERTGTLFEGRYKKILIKKQAHFLHLPNYIHLNPLDLHSPEWRDKKLKNYKKSLNFINNYKWSSFLDYSGIDNFPIVTSREFLFEVFGARKNYTKQLKEWLEEMSLCNISDITLED